MVFVFFRIFDRAELQWSWCAFKLNLCGVAKHLLTLCNYDVLICCGTCLNMKDHSIRNYPFLRNYGSGTSNPRLRNYEPLLQELLRN